VPLVCKNGVYVFSHIQESKVKVIILHLQHFKDYMTQLDDILTRKVACIESLREKLSKYTAQ